MTEDNDDSSLHSQTDEESDHHEMHSALLDGSESRAGIDLLDSESHENKLLREQDRFLPIANIARIMKRILPESGKVSKEAKECCQECVSEFISFITSEASERCQNEKRKTINGEDVLWAMHTLGFENFVEPLKLFLFKYRETSKGEKPNLSEDFPTTVRESQRAFADNNVETDPQLSATLNMQQPQSLQIVLPAQSLGQPQMNALLQLAQAQHSSQQIIIQASPNASGVLSRAGQQPQQISLLPLNQAKGNQNLLPAAGTTLRSGQVVFFDSSGNVAPSGRQGISRQN